MFMSIEIRGLCAGILKFRVNFECTWSLHNAHAQIISWQRRAEVKNSCFLVDWSCRLPFKEDSLREGEWVCHEYN